jgi:hypothetical protein
MSFYFLSISFVIFLSSLGKEKEAPTELPTPPSDLFLSAL